jgi:hypothetical protein
VRCIQCTTQKQLYVHLIQRLCDFLNGLYDGLKFPSELPEQVLLGVGLRGPGGLPGGPRGGGRFIRDRHTIESEATGCLPNPLALCGWLRGIGIKSDGADMANRVGVASGIHFLLVGGPIRRGRGFLFNGGFLSATTIYIIVVSVVHAE